MSTVLGPDGRLYESMWSPGSADAVSAVLMHDHAMNEFVLDTTTKSQTDWVITMPTKRYYTATGGGNATKLFQRNFSGTAGSCDDLMLNVYDREELAYSDLQINQYSLFDPPPPLFLYTACWSGNVFTFFGNGTRSNVFGSTNSHSIAPVGFSGSMENGWLSLGFRQSISAATANVHRLISDGATSISGRGQPTSTGNTITYVGLPVIGFAAVSYTNGTLVVGSQNVLSNYGGNFVHKISTLMQ
jgi:hypothetical protein